MESLIQEADRESRLTKINKSISNLRGTVVDFEKLVEKIQVAPTEKIEPLNTNIKKPLFNCIAEMMEHLPEELDILGKKVEEAKTTLNSILF